MKPILPERGVFYELMCDNHYGAYVGADRTFPTGLTWLGTGRTESVMVPKGTVYMYVRRAKVEGVVVDSSAHWIFGHGHLMLCNTWTLQNMKRIS